MPSLYEAHVRHAQYYKTLLDHANHAYGQGGEALIQSLSLFDIERPNITSGFRWAVAHKHDSNDVARLCSDYLAGGVEIFRLRQLPRERIEWLEQALVAARLLQRLDAIQTHLGNIAVAYAELGEPQRAIAYHEQAVVLARLLKDRRMEAKALGNLGIACTKAHNAERAINYHLQQIAISRELQDRHRELVGLGGLASAHEAMGEPHNALPYYQDALRLSREMGNLRSEAATLSNLGLIYVRLGRNDEADQSYIQARALAQSLGDIHMEKQAMWSLGVLEAKRGNLTDAVVLMRPLVEVEQRMGYADAQINANRLAQLEHLLQQESSNVPWWKHWIKRIFGSK